MHRILPLLALCLLAASPVRAADAPASVASLKALLEITQASKLVDSTMGQMDGMMQSTMQQSTGGRPLTSEQQAIVDESRARLKNMLRESMSWDKLEPVMIGIYQKSFTQKEVDGMLQFYRSPPGQAVVAKMPVVMQHSIEAVQGLVQSMMPKIQQLAKDTAGRLQAAGQPQPKAP